ncbi:MAG: glycine betaine ABC transporter substrate-binding protein [Pseudomonadota bacterium]
MRRFRVLAVALLLGACGDAPIVVGSKEPAQDRIVGEMFALVLEEAGIPVERRIGLGDSAANFEALRSGAIDVYPEYTGTALTLIGAPPTQDAEAALERLREAYGALGLVFLEPLGFESSYAIVTRPGLATEAGLETVGDLRPVARGLTFGVTETFAARPTDGLDAALDRYGLAFREVVIAPGSERAPLYDGLLTGDIDVMVGFSTDPEIVDFGLRTLRIDLPILTSYAAVPLASEAALAREPRLAEALGALAGTLDSQRIRTLTRQVQIAGRTPRAAAASALVDLGLSARAIAEPNVPLLIAVDNAEIGTPVANATLRAVRIAMPGRNVGLLQTGRPMAAIPTREARLALAPSLSHFDVTETGLVRDDRIETLAVVGTTVVHALARVDGPDRLDEARRIATGPVGSASHKLVQVLAAHVTPEPQILPLADTSRAAAIAALRDGDADTAVLVRARERLAGARALSDLGDDLRLIDAATWWAGAARLDLPFLRTARVAGGGETEPVASLAMQTTLVGPAPPPVTVLGRQGPSSYSAALHPIPDDVVLALDEALGANPDVGPHLRRAAALVPRVAPEPSALNPDPSHAILLIGIAGFLAFAGWLLVRPRREAGGGDD